MDFMSPSPLSYGRMNEAAENNYKRKTFKRLIVIVASSVLLLAVIVSAALGIIAHKPGKTSDGSNPTGHTSAASVLETICNVTLYPKPCSTSLANVNSLDPKVFFEKSLVASIEEHSRLSDYTGKLVYSTGKDELINSAFRACGELFEDALEYLNDTIRYFRESDREEKILSSKTIEDVRTKLSVVLADQDTCLDSLEEIRESNATHYDQNAEIIENLQHSVQNPKELVSNSLAIVTRILGEVTEAFRPRRLLGWEETKLGFPVWVGKNERRFLLDQNRIRPNVTVAKDRTGDYTTINEAVAAVPEKSKARFVIYVKQGVYVENVVLGSSKWNVMMYGDGSTKTVISGSKNRVDSPGLQTYKTATFGVEGRGFLGKDIGFKNTAGPEKKQAVAFRSKSDYTVMYRCAFDGYQDTLYAHTSHQFYRDCDISGTVDFICGHAAAVFQNCKIQPRRPLTGQYNTITAQGKNCPMEVSGFSIIKATISPFNGENFAAVTYLGRPWKPFSTTVVMKTLIGGLVSPAGWIPWNTAAGPPKTLFYGEYNNTGLGSGLGNRVKWVGYRPTMTMQEAQRFTVGGLLKGKDWLPETGVPFDESL